MRAQWWPVPTDPPIAFTLDGHEYVLDLPTAQWIGAWAAADFTGLTLAAEASSGDSPRLWWRLADPTDPFDLPDTAAIAHAVTEEVAGMSWPRAVRLSQVAYGSWEYLDATATFDPMTAPPRRVLALAFKLRVQALDPEKTTVAQFAKHLENPAGIAGCPQRRRSPITAAPSSPVPVPDPAGLPPAPVRPMPVITVGAPVDLPTAPE